MIDDHAELGLLVKLCREHRGQTQEQLAAALQLSRTAVAHLEQGLRLPEPGALARLCRHMGLPEALWAGFIPRDSLYPMVVRCHCRTYATPPALGTGAADQRRASLVKAVRRGEPWADGKRTVDDPYASSARRMRRAFPRLFLNRTFVPVPRGRAGRGRADDPWPALRLAEAHAREGTACRVAQLFVRTRAVRKAEGSDPAARPTVAEHLTTLALKAEAVPPGVVLVDDVTERGATLMACATRLVRQGWRGEVDALVVAYVRQAADDPARDGHELSFGWDGKWSYPVREG